MIINTMDSLDLWETLSRAVRPIVLYGMGDGGDKILDVCARFSIPIAGVFASDGFVRGQNFRGYTVSTLAALEDKFGDMIVLLAFASNRLEVLATIDAVATRHTLYAPDVPVCGDVLFTRQYLQQRKQDISSVYHLLADDASRNVYTNLLHYKYTGRIEFLYRVQSPRCEIWKSIIMPHCDDVFVDAGAYNGDTVREFLSECVDHFAGILAIEPDRRNFCKLEAYLNTLSNKNIRCVNVGVWNCEATLPFAHKSGRQAALGDTGIPTAVNSVDNLLQGGSAGVIKYDVEGAEKEALIGTARTIARNMPRLMVSAYHRTEDLFDLPPLIRKLYPDCRIFLRHHPYIPAWDTNFYVLPPLLSP